MPTQKDFGSIKYRVMKMLFRKYMHDVANKVQIFMAQQSLARKQNEKGGDVSSFLEKIKLTAQEQTEHLNWTRQKYLNRTDYFVECAEVNIQTILSGIQDYFSKRSKDKDIKLNISNVCGDHKVNIEMNSFLRYVLHPLLGYITAVSSEGDVIEVEAVSTSPHQLRLILHFSGLDESQIELNSADSVFSADEDNIFLVASDFLAIQRGQFSIEKSSRISNGAAISLVLTVT